MPHTISQDIPGMCISLVHHHHHHHLLNSTYSEVKPGFEQHSRKNQGTTAIQQSLQIFVVFFVLLPFGIYLSPSVSSLTPIWFISWSATIQLKFPSCMNMKMKFHGPVTSMNSNKCWSRGINCSFITGPTRQWFKSFPTNIWGFPNWNGGTQQPWVFQLKMIILGWVLEVPPFKETPIYHLPKFTISEISVSASSVISRSLRSSMMTTMIHKRCTARFVLVRTRPSSDNACLPFTHHNYLGESPIEMNWNELKRWEKKQQRKT